MQFRTKARAVDLLGKGQIADLPTAITELWKNGYDAYADNLKAEIYLKGHKGLNRPLFVMSDDGKGMSRRDVLERWLVLGTDSKSRVEIEENESEETLWKRPRIKAGEKGIGRLSVAFLGTPMLMLTKKIGHPLQAMYFDWRLLENYNLFLDDIIIPVTDISLYSDFTNSIEELKKDFLKNFENIEDSEGNPIWEESQIELKTEIEKSTNNLELSELVFESIVSDIIDLNDDHGSKFIIFEPIEQIIELTNKDEDNLEDKKFVISSLSGFINSFKDNHNNVNYEIPVYKGNGEQYDFLNSEGNFFTSKDYELADVIINGEFDGNGSFYGELTIYDETIPYSYTNPRKKDSRSYFGSVPIKLGYCQGLESESKLKGDAYNKISSMVSEYGGLYIYRDNFRVLPYGRTDFDFLGFERRRALKASEYYFSHRRMFGYLELSRNRNKNLKDKSSREGLINNAAYRAFKNDLESFFKELAQEFFKTEPRQSIFRDKQHLLKEQHETIKADKLRETQEKREFSASLKKYPDQFEKYQTEYRYLISRLEEKTKDANILYSDIEDILDRIHTLDIEYKNMLPRIPKRYKPTETQLDRLDKYESKLIEFNETIKRDSAELMESVKEKLEVQELKKEFIKNYQKYNANLEKHIYSNKQSFESKLDELKAEFTKRANRILNDLNFEKDELTRSITSKEQILNATNKVDAKFEFLRNQIDKELFPIVEHLKRLSFDIDEELLQGAYKAEYENIKNRWEQTRETAQLGVAVEIVDHEYNHLYSTINHVLDKLSMSNGINSNSDFAFLKSLIKQLEEKYDLLSPLYRISGVLVKDIKCSSIYEYLKKFFANKLSTQGVSIEMTDSFKEHVISIKEPVIHTVFINIINNALYWLRNTKEKRIRLDYWKDTEEMLIMNSGLRIEDHRLERIFELFYSNRPNGRGIGLYLAKESLNENYFDIYATNDKMYNQLKGACFVIKPLK
ncbi:sensor histidine kinase [Bacteroidota bacterium]